MFEVTIDFVSFQKTYEFKTWNDAKRYEATTGGRIVAYVLTEKETDLENELDKIII